MQTSARKRVLATLSTDDDRRQSLLRLQRLRPAFQQIQHDTEAYYILGFRSTNTLRDGSYRRLTIRVNRNDVRLDYRTPATMRQQTSNTRRQKTGAGSDGTDTKATFPPRMRVAVYWRRPVLPKWTTTASLSRSR